MNNQAVRLEITFEYPGEYIGHKACILATQEEEASIFDRSKWQPVSLLEQHFQQLFNRKVQVLVVHHC
jgi:ethanolamine utilization protein EutP (predicted NTPase)